MNFNLTYNDQRSGLEKIEEQLKKILKNPNRNFYDEYIELMLLMEIVEEKYIFSPKLMLGGGLMAITTSGDNTVTLNYTYNGEQLLF